jgi:hypothetical protein
MELSRIERHHRHGTPSLNVTLESLLRHESGLLLLLKHLLLSHGSDSIRIVVELLLEMLLVQHLLLRGIEML